MNSTSSLISFSACVSESVEKSLVSPRSSMELCGKVTLWAMGALLLCSRHIRAQDKKNWMCLVINQVRNAFPSFLPYTLENVTENTPALSAKAGEVGSCRASRGRFRCNGSLHPARSLDFFLLLMFYTNMFLLSIGELPVYFWKDLFDLGRWLSWW